MIEVYPQLAALKIESAWSGLMAYARHYMPQVGQLDEGLWHCTAFGGHGLNTTAAAGGLIAAAIAEGDDRYRLFAPFGLAWNGGPLGPVAAQLTYWKLQLQDWWAERGVRSEERRHRAQGRPAVIDHVNQAPAVEGGAGMRDPAARADRRPRCRRSPARSDRRAGRSAW